MYKSFEEYYNTVKTPNINDIKIMIENGLDDYNEGLYFACEKSHLEAVQFMIDNGADDFSEILDCVCKAGNLEIFNLILLLINPDIIYERTLNYACYGGNLEIINIIIKQGLDFFGDGLRGACHGGHIKIINLMILKIRDDWGCGDKVDDPENEEMTGIWDVGLHGALDGNHSGIVNLMIMRGARDYKILYHTKNPYVFKLYMKYTGDYNIKIYEKLVINYCPIYYLITYKNLSKLRPLPMDLIRLLQEFI